MPDIIQLLPDSVANQIAAGEVIQRPASAVKEMLENSIDSGADRIELIIKDSGKTLIQVCDNGSGMSTTDARMSFERHATSKIRNADELFRIKTKGFRGEALASIAAISQVELKTRRSEDAVGTKILIEGSEVTSQEPCAAPEGTSIAVKNLFYNVPARRNFLKTDAVEMRHIIEEFQRVALAHPPVHFSLHHNDQEVFNLPASKGRQRIVNLFGSRYNERLVPIEEETDIVTLRGFVVKPEFAKKTRGDQYLFVNDRFIRSGYLHHAINKAFSELIPADSHPGYFIFLSVPTDSIDVNIHPTKTEVKFREEKPIYAILHSTVKRSLGKYNISPSLDFEQETSIDVGPAPRGKEFRPPTIASNPDYNPFDNPTGKPRSGGSSGHTPAMGRAGWQALYEVAADDEHEQQPIFQREEERKTRHDEVEKPSMQPAVMQWLQRYLVTTVQSGLLVIDQQRAHERILYEQAMNSLEYQRGNSQQLLFPERVELPASDRELLTELLPHLGDLGFMMEEFGGSTVVVHGVPTDASNAEVADLLEELLENFKNSASDVKSSQQQRVARAMARSMRMSRSKPLSKEEMNNLIDQLFACEVPYYSPSGKAVIVTFAPDELERKFQA